MLSGQAFLLGPASPAVFALNPSDALHRYSLWVPKCYVLRVHTEWRSSSTNRIGKPGVICSRVSSPTMNAQQSFLFSYIEPFLKEQFKLVVTVELYLSLH